MYISKEELLMKIIDKLDLTDNLESRTVLLEMIKLVEECETIKK